MCLFVSCYINAYLLLQTLYLPKRCRTFSLDAITTAVLLFSRSSSIYVNYPPFTTCMYGFVIFIITWFFYYQPSSYSHSSSPHVMKHDGRIFALSFNFAIICRGLVTLLWIVCKTIINCKVVSRSGAGGRHIDDCILFSVTASARKVYLVLIDN